MLEIEKNWIEKRPIIISGPCSAETEEQVVNTAKQLIERGKITFLRAGIWKPRTRPNSFEGVGEIGLKWLKNAGKEVGLPVITEVAKASHVEMALKEDVDALWIGARTTVNPFSVQELADALKGIDVPVFVKNPINPDIELWIGALERLNNAGIRKLGAIHRGFSSFEKTIYRNEPKWEIPIELMRLFPELPIICDPSHIGGSRDLLLSISQKAMDLEMDGLMIESHIDPNNAWSDAKQQVTPENFNKIVDQIVFRRTDIKDDILISKLEILRKKIDLLDREIIAKLGERMKIAAQIGQHKKENDVTILQVNRWDEIVNQRKVLAKEAGLSEAFIEKYLKIIHKESINKQTDVMNKQ